MVATTAVAEDLEPRAYANTPVGINFLLLGYSDLHGNVTANPSVPLQNAKLNIKTIVFAFARSLDVWGRSGKFDIVVPEARLTGSALFAGEPRERNVTGLIDPRLRFSVNLYGAPAMSLAEFPSYQQDVIIGASLAITAPLGQYDSSRLVNLGNNRWSFKPELGVSKRLGPVTLELSAATTFYTDNNQYLGDRTFSQNPTYQAQLFASEGAHTRTGSEYDAVGIVWHQRLTSIDALRGLVIIFMLLDHVRETFFLHRQVTDPMLVDSTEPTLFFSRTLAHLCAPVFVLLTGLSAFLYGEKHQGTPSMFLF
eukprot:gene14837-14634_t